MRLIDADNVISVLKILQDKCADDKAFEQAISVVESVSTIEAEPIRHGRWVDTRKWLGGVACSQCSWVCDMDWDKWNYCPHCGAKMESK